MPYSKHREGAGKSKKQERAHILYLLCKIPPCIFFFYWQYFTRAPASKGLQYATGIECFPRCHGQPLNCTIIGMKRQHSFGCSTEIQQTHLHTGQIHNHQYMVPSPDLSRTRFENTAELEPSFKQIPYYGCMSRMATDLLKITYIHQCLALLVE